MSNESLVRSMYELFNQRDFERGAALCTAETQIVDMPTGLKRYGTEGYHQYVGGWSSVFPDARVEVTNLFVSGEHATVEFRATGTHTGDLQSQMGPIPPTGRKVDVPFCEVWVVKDGKVASVHSYYDVATFMAQLGLMK